MRKQGLILCALVLLLFFSVACSREERKEVGPDQDAVTNNSKEKSEELIISVDDSYKMEQEPAESLHCIVQVQTDNQYGSGVLWDRQQEFWYFVTAAHVVEALEQVEIYFVEEDKICVAQVHLVEGLDLAFLQTDVAKLPENVKNLYGECSVASIEMKSGDRILATGFNAMADALIYEGKVWEPWIYTEDFDNYMLMCQCEAKPGMSGGAVFTLEEEMLGIVCGQNEEGMLAVLPVAVIEGEYNLFINY